MQNRGENNMQNRGENKIVGHMFHGGIAACDECTKRCLTIHHPEQIDSTVTRFFKIMHGKHWSDFLYLPPKFTRYVRDLVGQKTQIEDSNGQKWTVQFSHVDGALVFQEGWHKFVEDHQLEQGEMLMFNYIKHRHFVVEIYGRSACEITDFNRGRKFPKKRSRSDQETVFHDETHQIRNKQFTTSKNIEDPSCMLDRDSGKYDVEDREFLFDLSNFEMGKNSSVAEKSDAFQTEPSGDINSSKDMPYDVSKFQTGETENNCLHDISSDALQTKLFGNSDSSKGMPDFSDTLQKAPSGIDIINLRTGVTNNYQSYGIFSDALLAKPSNNSESGKYIFDGISKFQALKTSVSPPFIARDMKSPYICSNLLVESDRSLNSKHRDASVTSSMLKDPCGKSAAMFKKEVLELGEEVYDFPRVSSKDAGITSTFGMKCGQIPSSVVQIEPDMADVFVPAVATSPFSAEVKSLAFLELPLCMPSIQGKRERGRGKVVYLKSSTTRLWPVLYPGKSSVKAFTDGWKTFCKGNSIRARDLCRFQLETYMPCVFKVVIIRKAGQSSEC